MPSPDALREGSLWRLAFSEASNRVPSAGIDIASAVDPVDWPPRPEFPGRSMPATSLPVRANKLPSKNKAPEKAPAVFEPSVVGVNTKTSSSLPLTPAEALFLFRNSLDPPGGVLPESGNARRRLFASQIKIPKGELP